MGIIEYEMLMCVLVYSCVIEEIINTEKIYVDELSSIVEV